MEENIHDDKLDDYVRNSFEGHEEDPPADMWNRVEGDLLPPMEGSALRAVYLRYSWHALAAVVILVLFSTLVCEHLYYEEKLREMTGKAQGGEILKERNFTEEDATGRSIHPNPNSYSPSELPVESKSNTIQPNSVPTSNLERATSQQPSSKASKAQVNQIVKSERKEGSFPATEFDMDVSQNLQNLSKSAGNPTCSIGTAISETSSHHPEIIAGQNAPNPLQIVFVPIPRILLEQPGSRSPALSAGITTKPVNTPSGWYLGLQTSLLSSIEKPRTPVSRPSRPAFSSKHENAGISTLWWLKTGKKLNTRFLLESGIGYQKSSRTATHTPKFRFGDGIHSGGPLATRRTFNYDLNTYSGTAEVSLRMETTSGSPVSDDESVALKITTTEQTELLRIPLSAGYRLGSGRFQGQLKAGLLGNFILKNELEISARVSQNIRIRPVTDTDGYTLQLDQKKFFLGYWMSAGAEFKWSKHISLVVESAILGDFPRRDQYNRRLQERFMLGFNLGANYYF